MAWTGAPQRLGKNANVFRWQGGRAGGGPGGPGGLRPWDRPPSPMASEWQRQPPPAASRHHPTDNGLNFNEFRSLKRRGVRGRGAGRGGRGACHLPVTSLVHGDAGGAHRERVGSSSPCHCGNVARRPTSHVGRGCGGVNEERCCPALRQRFQEDSSVFNYPPPYRLHWPSNFVSGWEWGWAASSPQCPLQRAG